MFKSEHIAQLTVANTVMSVLILGLLIMERCDSRPGSGALQPDIVDLRTATKQPSEAGEPPAEAPSTAQPVNQIATQSTNNDAGQTQSTNAATGSGTSVVDFSALLEATVEPLRVAASDHQEDGQNYLPTDDELAAATASKSLESPETQLVLKKLEAGYAQYNMPFPSLKLPSNPGANDGSLATQQGGVTPPEPTIPPGVESGKDSPAVRSYMLPTIERLQTEINAKGISGDAYLPSEAELSAAINSGTFVSPETEAVLTKLRQGFNDCEIDFPEPGSIEVGETAPPPTEPTEGETNQAEDRPQSEKRDGDFAQQEIIVRAYFEGQIQRIKMLSEQAGEDLSSLIPSDSEIQQAAQTGKIESPESQAAIEKLASAYAALNQPFNPPISSQ